MKPRQPSPELVIVAQAQAKLSSAQRTFNKLTAQLHAKRAQVASWEAYADVFNTRLQEHYHPVVRKIAAAQRDMALAVDRVLCSTHRADKLGKRDREGLTDFLLDLVDNLLDVGPDPELEAVFERHSELSRAEILEEERDIANSVFEGVFGESLPDDEAQTLEDIIEQVHKRAAARDAEAAAAEQAGREQRAQSGAKPNRADAQAARKAKAAQEIKQSVQDIFRKLVRALHPDREPDPTEKLRKTDLMKRINLAYQANDVLTLLTLQMEVEQLDEADLAALPASRLKHYNQVLRDQHTALDRELSIKVSSMMQAMSMEGRFLPQKPRDVDRLLNASIADAKRSHSTMVDDCKLMADPIRRKPLIKALVQIQRQRLRAPNFDDLFDDVPDRFDDVPF